MNKVIQKRITKEQHQLILDKLEQAFWEKVYTRTEKNEQSYIDLSYLGKLIDKLFEKLNKL
jgi:hypothetical protein